MVLLVFHLMPTGTNPVDMNTEAKQRENGCNGDHGVLERDCISSLKTINVVTVIISCQHHCHHHRCCWHHIEKTGFAEEV